MSRELLEKMARAIYDAELAAEKKGPISDATWSSIWASPRNIIRRHYEGIARAILSLLADPANISDEMVKAADRAHYETIMAMPGHDDFGDPAYDDLHPDTMEIRFALIRAAIAAAFAKERADNLTGERKP